MPSILITPPAAEPITLAEAKAHLRIVQGDDDALVASLITAARRLVETRTGLCLIAQGWTCFRDGWPASGIIELPLAPLISVDEIGVFGADGQKTVIDPSSCTVDAASRPPRIFLGGSCDRPRPGRAVNGIAIAVQAGFGTAPASVPEPLREAVLLLTGHWYANRGDEQGGGLPVSLAALLAPFRAVQL